MTVEDVSGLKAKIQEVLREVRQLKDKNMELEQQNKSLRERIDTNGVVIADNESPRDKFFREQAKRLDKWTAGTPEYQAEIDAILAEPEAVAMFNFDVAEVESKLKARGESLRSQVEQLAQEQSAARLACDLSPRHADLLAPHLKERIRGKWEGDEYVTTFAAADGTAISEDELIREFRARPEFSKVITGASEADKAAHERRVAEVLGSTPVTNNKITRAQLDAMSPSARIDAMRGGTTILEN